MLDLNAASYTFAPELWLALMGVIGLTIGAIIKDRFNGLSFKFGAAALFLAAGLAAFYYVGGEAFNALVRTNPYVNFAKIVAFALAGWSVLLAEPFLKRHDTIRYEYPLLIIFASLGMGVILSANDLMTLYMGVETLSLSSYVLAAFHRDSARSSEAGLKYFVLGALASGLLLYGISLVYGFTGSTNYQAIAAAAPNMGMLFGMVMMISGLAFKVSAAPMHVWTPDVYEGAPSPVGMFFSTAPKFAAMVVFANIMFTLFGGVLDQWQLIIAIISALSMVIGAFGGLAQTNLKRLLGYSSIANVGFGLIAVAAGQKAGAAPLLVFMTIYALSTLGLFAGVLAMRRRGGMVEGMDELSGMMRHSPWLAIGLSVLIWSVAGLPPFGGFFGKWEVLRAGVDAGLIPLVVIGVITSVVSCFYYLRIIKIVWFNEPIEKFEPVDLRVLMTVLATAAIAGVVFMIFIQRLSSAATGAASGLPL